MKKIKVDTISLRLENGKKVFFASDFHLGSPSYEESRKREKKIIQWIEEHQNEMGALFLLGDVFDYWFEYRHVVPKGFTRLFGKIAELTDSGIPIYFICGNHDSWTRTYFQQELNLRVCPQNAHVWINDTHIYLGHGDGLGPDDKGYKFIKTLFASPLSRIFFAFLHPWIGYVLACSFSRRSKQADQLKLNRESYEKKKNENLMCFMQETLFAQPDIRYFIFAHRHWPLMQEVLPVQKAWLPSHKAPKKTTKMEKNPLAIPETHCQYLNTGDWIQYFSYGVFDGEKLKLQGTHTEKVF